MRLIDAHLLNREHDIKQMSEETYISCEGHDGDQVFSRVPCVCFWLIRCQPESDDFVFSSSALKQLATLAWVVDHTFEDGFAQILDWEHRFQEPVARITVAGEDPFCSHDEVPEHWTPAAFCLRLR